MQMLKISLKTAIFIILCCLLSSQFCFAAQKGVKSQIVTITNTSQRDTLPPSPPGDLSVINRTHTVIALNWSKSSDNVGVKAYQLYRDGKRIITTAKNTYTNKDLIPGKQYTYSIRAYDAAGNISEDSETLFVSTVSDYQPPTIPNSPFASAVTYNTITLNWKPSSDNIGIKRYEIYMCGTKKASASGTSYICKGLSPGSTYNFTIKAVDTAGNYSSASSTVYADTIADTATPSIPTGLKAVSVTESEVALAWSPSSDNVKVKKYEIYRDGKIVSSTSKTTYVNKKLIPGKSFKYTIRSVDTSGLKSAVSACLAITTVKDLKAPTAPESLKARYVKGSSVSLSWNASTDNVRVKGYKLYCNGTEIATTTRKTRSVKNPSDLGIGIYWIRAFDESDNLSEKSNAVTVVTIK